MRSGTGGWSTKPPESFRKSLITDLMSTYRDQFALAVATLQVAGSAGAPPARPKSEPQGPPSPRLFQRGRVCTARSVASPSPYTGPCKAWRALALMDTALACPPVIWASVKASTSVRSVTTDGATREQPQDSVSTACRPLASLKAIHPLNLVTRERAMEQAKST